MPVDSRIPLGMEYSDPVAKFQQGFGTAREVVNAPLKTEALKQDNELTKLKTAASKIDAIGGLLYGVDNQDKYTAKRNVAISQGLARAEEIPETYDPNVVAGWQNSLEQAKMQIDQAYKLATIKQMEAGGATGTLLDRMRDDEGLRDTYFGKVNANKGLEKNPATGQVEVTQGYNPAVASTEGAKKEAEQQAIIGTAADVEKQKQLGEASGKAEISLPKIEQQADYLDTLLAELGTHPGLKYSVGKSSVLPALPGTSAADFKSRLAQVKGAQFLQAFEALKGAGAITEVEGKKAEQSVARMETSQTEAEFKRALKDYRNIIKAGKAAAQRRAGSKMGAMPPQESVATGESIQPKNLKDTSDDELKKLLGL